MNAFDNRYFKIVHAKETDNGQWLVFAERNLKEISSSVAAENWLTNQARICISGSWFKAYKKGHEADLSHVSS